MAIRIGISGWRYAPWRGKFYPKGLPQRRELEYAARRFSSVEINGSFYSLQRPENYAAWRETTPRGFVFAIKGSRYITHMLRLQGVETALANFFASGVLCLRERLGPFLWQLPPSLRYEPERLEAFFRQLPRDTDQAQALARRRDRGLMRGRTALSTDRNRRLRHALEVRHESFHDPACIALLRRHGIGLVVADTAGRWPLLEDVTAGFVYIRLHGDAQLYVSGYGDAALDDWAARIRAWSRGRQPAHARRASRTAPPKRKTRDVYCYFDNDAKVRAPFDALALMRRLGLEKPAAIAGRSERKSAVGGLAPSTQATLASST